MRVLIRSFRILLLEHEVFFLTTLIFLLLLDRFFLPPEVLGRQGAIILYWALVLVGVLLNTEIGFLVLAVSFPFYRRFNIPGITGDFYNYDILMVGIPLVWMIQRFFRGKPMLDRVLVRTPFNGPLFLFLLVSSVALFLTPIRLGTTETFDSGFNYLLRRILTISSAFYFVIAIVQSKNFSFRFLRAILIVSLIVAAIGFLQSLTWEGWSVLPDLALEEGFVPSSRVLRIYGTFGDYRAFTTFAFLVLPLILVTGLTSDFKKWWLLAHGLWPVLLILVFLSHKRGALLAAMCALTVVFLFSLSRRHLLQLGILMVLAGGFAVIFLAREDWYLHYVQATLENPSSDRLVFWLGMGRVILDNPLLGAGFNSTRLIANANQYYFTWAAVGETFVQKGNPHNMFVYVGQDTGLLGLAAFLFLLVRICMFLWNVFQCSLDPAIRKFALGSLGSLAGLIVFGVFNPGIILFENHVFYFWIMLALLFRANWRSTNFSTEAGRWPTSTVTLKE